MYRINHRIFRIWKFEKWWIAFDREEFYPEKRKHLFGNYFWKQ